MLSLTQIYILSHLYLHYPPYKLFHKQTSISSNPVATLKSQKKHFMCSSSLPPITPGFCCHKHGDTTFNRIINDALVSKLQDADHHYLTRQCFSMFPSLSPFLPSLLLILFCEFNFGLTSWYKTIYFTF